MPDRWASFDCYGTLIDWNTGIASALGALWPRADQRRLLADYHRLEPIVQAGRALSYREVLQRSLRALAAVSGLALEDSDAGGLADSLPGWPVFAEVPGALAEIRQRGFGIAILSNTDPELLAASLERIGLPVDLTITAADAGSYKPAPGHWERFFERSGADPSRHVHVGASLFHDIEPAAGQDMAAIWVNRAGERSDVPRAAELPDLAQLPATLDRLVP